VGVSERSLTHLGEDGSARMVDVGAKAAGERVARARARVRMSSASAEAVERGGGPKGEVMSVARLAGVMAAKQTGRLIPLAHPLELTFVDVEGEVDVARGLVELTSEVRTVSRTGVEMEAMTACTVAALTVYDMVKAVQRDVEIEQVVLLEKHGGRHDYVRPQDGAGSSAAAHRAPAHADAASPALASARPQRIRAALITVSTSKARGEGSDESGPRLAALAERLGAEVVAGELLSDDRALIETRLRHWADDEGCELILSSGGTGVAPGDLTPEATAAVIEREIPGLGEAMRAASAPHTGNWMLSRALAGVRGATLIVNLPGNPASIEQVGEALAAPIAHALELIAGRSCAH
jgi:cyclic pyranopterin monophosphate synthase